MKLSYKKFNSLNQFIQTQKDKIEEHSHNNVVYKISCQNCNATYVGQTKRQLKTRLHEHKNDIKKSSSPSVISAHRINFDHQFDWQRTKILDKESSYGKRLTSEMIFIKSQDNGLNKQSDTESLPESYISLLELLH